MNNDSYCFINYIYEYSTPFGILNNNIQADKLSNIFNRSLKEKEDEYYNNKTLKFFIDNKNNKYQDNTIIQFKHYHDIGAGGDDHINLYIIEDYQGGVLNINPKFIEKLKLSTNYYFIFYNTFISNIDTFNKGIEAFKIKNKILRHHTILLSTEEYQSKNWNYHYCDDSFFENMKFIEFIKSNLYENPKIL